MSTSKKLSGAIQGKRALANTRLIIKQQRGIDLTKIHLGSQISQQTEEEVLLLPGRRFSARVYTGGELPPFAGKYYQLEER